MKNEEIHWPLAVADASNCEWFQASFTVCRCQWWCRNSVVSNAQSHDRWWKRNYCGRWSTKPLTQSSNGLRWIGSSLRFGSNSHKLRMFRCTSNRNFHILNWSQRLPTFRRFISRDTPSRDNNMRYNFRLWFSYEIQSKLLVANSMDSEMKEIEVQQWFDGQRPMHMVCKICFKVWWLDLLGTCLVRISQSDSTGDCERCGELKTVGNPSQQWMCIVPFFVCLFRRCNCVCIAANLFYCLSMTWLCLRCQRMFFISIPFISWQKANTHKTFDAK